MTTRSAICAEARSWLRTPYHHHGDIKDVGVDCAMILVRVYSAVGLTPHDFDPRPYAQDWHLHHTEEKYLGFVNAYATEVSIPLPGDIALWRFGRAYSHAAIILDTDGTILHAYKDAQMVVLGNLSETTLSKREHKFFRVNGIED